MARVRHALNFARLKWALIALCATRTALAQECHSPGLHAASGVQAAVESGSFENAYWQGSYQGVRVAAEWERAAFFLRASLGAYRAVYNGLSVHGLGDATLQLSVPLLYVDTFNRENDSRTLWRVGALGAAHLPTGDAEHHLGAGHIMVMPGVWMDVHSDASSFSLTAAWARALTGEEHTHPASIIQPMNLSELQLAAQLSVFEDRMFQGHLGVRGAAPLGPVGAERIEACAQWGQRARSLLTGIEVCVPLRGDAIEWRVQSSLKARLKFLD